MQGLRQAKVNALREPQSAGGEEFDPLPVRAEPPRSGAKWVPPKKGEGEWRVGLKQETNNSDHDTPLLMQSRTSPLWGGRRRTEPVEVRGFLSVLDRAFKGEL